MLEIIGTGIVRCKVCGEYLEWPRPYGYAAGMGDQRIKAYEHLNTHKEKISNTCKED